ncbi:MAG: hypothetical protein JRN54_02800 [Nitrososphaerota archaeon]|jgi:hypothetical protein|nr:hypothetical protein [Nitrososphaerota archaeon]
MMEVDYRTRSLIEVDENGREKRLHPATTNCLVGATAEIEIAADLMRHGFAVYRNQAPVGPVDMVAISMNGNGRVYKIQATTGRVGSRGGRYFDPHTHVAAWDILAVSNTGRVTYFDRNKCELTILMGEKNAFGPIVKRPTDDQPQSYILPVPLVPGASTKRRRRSNGSRRWVPLPGRVGVYVRPWDSALDVVPSVETGVDRATPATTDPAGNPTA